MNGETIPARCADCPVLQPYIADVERLESVQMDDENVRLQLINRGFPPADIDRFDIDNMMTLEQSRYALDQALLRTIGCAGFKMVRGKNAEAQPVCMSPLESDQDMTE